MCKTMIGFEPFGNNLIVERLMVNKKRSMKVAQINTATGIAKSHSIYGPVEITKSIALSELTAFPAVGTVPTTSPLATLGSLLKN